MSRTLRLIASDLRHKAAWVYESERPADVLKALLADGTPAMLLYRLMQASRRHRLAPLEMAFNRLNSMFCGCVIGRVRRCVRRRSRVRRRVGPPDEAARIRVSGQARGRPHPLVLLPRDG